MLFDGLLRGGVVRGGLAEHRAQLELAVCKKRPKFAAY
jgi:hypothetical protein